MCAKCRHPVEQVMRVSNALGSWLDVSCHGKTQRLADEGNDKLPLLAFADG